jgi:hypothetical protein
MDVFDYLSLRSLVFYMIVVSFVLILITYLNTKRNVITAHVDIKIDSSTTGFYDATWRQPASTLITAVNLTCRENFTNASGTITLQLGTVLQGVDIMAATAITTTQPATGMVKNTLADGAFTLLGPVYASKKRDVYASLNIPTAVLSGGKVRVSFAYTYI